MKPIFVTVLAGASLVAGGVLTAQPFADRAAAPRPDPARQTASDATGGAALRTVTLRVDNMFCASCPYIVRRTLEQVEGVRTAEVSYRQKTATVVYDPARCDPAKLAAATAGMGYPSTVVR